MKKRSDWLTAREAHELISKNSGYRVSRYIASLYARRGHILVWKVRPRVHLYRRTDVELIRIHRDEHASSVLSTHWQSLREQRQAMILACLDTEEWMNRDACEQRIRERFSDVKVVSVTLKSDLAALVQSGTLEEKGLPGKQKQYRKVSSDVPSCLEVVSV